MERIPTKRSHNFIEEECNLLIDLVRKYREVLENKKLDSATNIQKEATWKRLADDFNRSSGRTARDWKVLRGKYDNLKKTCKKRFAEAFSSGEGPCKPSIITQIDYNIKEIIGMQVVGESSQFDQGEFITKDVDSVSDEDKNEMTFYLDPSSEVPEIIIEPESPMENQIPSSSSKNVEIDDVATSNNHPRQQYSRSSLKFGPKRRRLGIDDTVAGPNLAEAALQKSELFTLQKKIYEEKLLMARAEHDMKMEALRLEIEERKLAIRLKESELMARAEQDMKIEVLRLEIEERKLAINLKEKELKERAERDMKMEDA